MLDTISAFIARMGEWLVPILMVLGTIYAAGSWVGKAYDKKQERKEKKEYNDILKTIADKENCSKEVVDLTKVIEDQKVQIKSTNEQVEKVQKQLIIMAQMFRTLFENASISRDAKDRLAVLSDKMEYNLDTDLLQKLENENAKLKEQLEFLSKPVELAPETEVEEDTESGNKKFSNVVM